MPLQEEYIAGEVVNSLPDTKSKEAEPILDKIKRAIALAKRLRGRAGFCFEDSEDGQKIWVTVGADSEPYKVRNDLCDQSMNSGSF